MHAFDRVQRKHPVLAVPVAVIKKFGDDQGGGLAALVAYYSFFSLFPLLLVFVTVLGYVLDGNSSLQKSVEDSVLAHLPVIGTQIHVHSLEGSGTALVIATRIERSRPSPWRSRSPGVFGEETFTVI